MLLVEGPGRYPGPSERDYREAFAVHLDDIDWDLIDILQADGRLGYRELGRRVGLSAPAVAARVRKLEQAGIIAGYRAVVDPERLGLRAVSYTHLRAHET